MLSKGKKSLPSSLKTAEGRVARREADVLPLMKCFNFSVEKVDDFLMHKPGFLSY